MTKDLQYDEQSLLQAVAGGSENDFRILVNRYSGLLFSYIYRYTDSAELAEEIVQDILVQVWLARETLMEIRNFRTYLFVLTRNYTINAVKKLLREREFRKNFTLRLNEEDSIRFTTEEQLSLIDAAIDQLPPQQQKAWILSRRESKSYQEVAAEMSVSRETVKTHIQLANAAIIKYVTQRLPLWLLITFLK